MRYVNLPFSCNNWNTVFHFFLALTSNLKFSLLRGDKPRPAPEKHHPARLTPQFVVKVASIQGLPNFATSIEAPAVALTHFNLYLFLSISHLGSCRGPSPGSKTHNGTSIPDNRYPGSGEEREAHGHRTRAPIPSGFHTPESRLPLRADLKRKLC